MNSLDWIILAFLTFAAFQGYRKGFILEIISVLALILGIIGGLKLIDFGKEFLSRHLEIKGDILPYLSFLFIFIIIVILLNLAGRAVKKILDMTLLGNLDDIAGLVIGILKWTLILSSLIWIASIIDLKLPFTWTEDSILYPYVSWLAPNLFHMLSGVFPFLEELIAYFAS
ncbi:MAG TPA: CvpA family protein [Cyclobacteriaceae bacterium]